MNRIVIDHDEVTLEPGLYVSLKEEASGMNRIRIEWNEISKKDRTIAGVATLDTWESWQNCADTPQTSTFAVEAGPGTLGFKGIGEGHLPRELRKNDLEDSVLYEKLKIMVQSYYDGVMGDPSIFMWHNI